MSAFAVNALFLNFVFHLSLRYKSVVLKEVYAPCIHPVQMGLFEILILSAYRLCTWYQFYNLGATGFEFKQVDR